MLKEESFSKKMHNKEHQTLVKLHNSQSKKPTLNKPRKRQAVRRRSAPIMDFAPRGGKPIRAIAPKPSECATLAFRQEPTLSNANGPPMRSALDLGSFRTKKISTHNNWADAVLNGIPTGDARYPDPFTLLKTTQTVVSSSSTITSIATSTSSTAASYDYADYGLFKGSPINTYGLGNSLAAGTLAFDWSARVSWYNCGLGSADFLTRPNGYVMDIIPRLTGPVHNVTLFAVPLLPFKVADISIPAPVGWPAAPNQGLTATQVSWGGREWELNSTSKGVRLISLPLDSRCFDFTSGNGERGSIANYSEMAWSGWCWWVNGMGAGDKLDIVFSACEEVVMKTSTTTQYAWPSSDKPSDSRARDQANNTVKEITSSGLNGFSMIDQVVDFAKEAWGIGKKVGSLIGALAGTFGFAPPLTPMASILSDRTALLTSTDYRDSELKSFVNPRGTITSRTHPPDEQKDEFEDLSKSVLIKELRKQVPQAPSTDGRRL